MSIANGAPKLTAGGVVRRKGENLGMALDNPERAKWHTSQHYTAFACERRRLVLTATIWFVGGSRGYGRDLAFFCKIGTNGRDYDDNLLANPIWDKDAFQPPSAALIPDPMQNTNISTREPPDDEGKPFFQNFTYQEVTPFQLTVSPESVPTVNCCFDPNLTSAQGAALAKAMLVSTTGEVTKSFVATQKGRGDSIWNAMQRADGVAGWLFPPQYNMFSFLLPSHSGSTVGGSSIFSDNILEQEDCYFDAPSASLIEPMLYRTRYGYGDPISPMPSGYLDQVDLWGEYYDSRTKDHGQPVGESFDLPHYYRNTVNTGLSGVLPP